MTPNKDDLEKLLELVRAATGPDRGLDLALAQSLVPDVVVARQRLDDRGYDPYTYWEYTGSIDAALALVERVLPGASVSMVKYGSDESCEASIWITEPNVDLGDAVAKTLPLAILRSLLATLRLSSLLAKEP